MAARSPHPTDMNATLRDRLILVEQLFLIAVVAQDEMAVEEISLEISQLINHFKAVEASGDLDDGTILLLSRVSQVITATTQCMLECEDTLQAGIISCSNLPLPTDHLPVSARHPTFTPYRLLFSHITSSGTHGILGRNNLLDACAYRWLLHNTHNPYPTSTQLQSIGDGSMTSVAQVELWFREVRDLIGWTRLSDEFFGGSLNATINAAKRVYLEHDGTIPSSVAFAFSKVKAFMETLFAEHPALLTLSSSHVDCSTQVLQPVPVVKNLLDDEIEDITPPPPVAGRKRNLSEDTDTSLGSDPHRPLKRLRAQSLRQVHPYSEHPSDSSIKALTHTSAIPVTSIQPLDPYFPVGSKASPDTFAFNSIGQRQTDLYDSASEKAVISSDLPVSHNRMHQGKLEDSPQVPSERHLNTSANHTWDQSPGSVPTFAWPMLPSLDHPPTDFTGASQITIRPDASVDLGVFDWNSIPNPLVKTPISMNQSASVYVPSSDLAPLNFGITGASQITVRPDAPVDLSVFDWNSIPNPLAETPIPMNQPASVYVPSSDLAAMNCELPDPPFLEHSAENYPLDDLGSLGDFSLLQFPIPTAFPSDVSASPASFSSDNSTFASPEMDWSAITDFVNQFTTFSAETPSAPSPSSTFDAAPSTPENPTGSLLPPPPHEVNKPISLLDPSIPPSAFLPAEPGIFTDDASNMWSLLCRLS